MFLARSYSHHSLLSALPKIPQLVKDAKQKGYKSIALCDEDTGSGLVEFYEECKSADIKPILGSTLRIKNLAFSGVNSSFGNYAEFSKLAILAKNKIGYVNLLELISLARTKQEDPSYHVTLDNLIGYLDGKKLNFLVLLCGNDHEFVSNLRQSKTKQAEEILKEYVDKIGTDNLLVELAYPLNSENLSQNRALNLQIIELCKKYGLKYVASSAPRYLERSQEEAFRVVLAIGKQQKLSQISLDRDFSLPTVEALKQTFDYALEAVEVEEIENQFDVELRTDYDKHADEAFFPKFDLPKGQVPGNRLTWETYIGLLSRFHPSQKPRSDWEKEFSYEKLEDLKKFGREITPDTTKLLSYPHDYWLVDGQTSDSLHKKTIQDYVSRIDYELDIIITKGYAEYFLVFGDIMKFCRDNKIVTNTRGSAAGSLVGYLNEINVLDPLLYNIPFERFLNPFRPSPPDIDGDFADDRREEVIKYITNKYGKENVSQIITFGTMLPRQSVRDVGRVLGVSYKKCDRLSKLIPIAPQGRKTTFEWALEASKELYEVYENDPDSKRIIDISKQIEGNYRHSSSHAAGLIITPTKLTDYVPLQWDSDHKMIVAQYDMKIGERVGLVKLDVLGITNLAILGNAINLTQERRKTEIDLLNIDVQEKKAFELLAKGRTMGTFQLSGAAMTKYLVDLEPTRVEDLMAMVALYRPGPMGSIPEYTARKKNPSKVKYLVPQMKKWMEASYGIFVYQEDLLMTAIELAGYNWGQADTLRKAMGKKIQKMIDEQHPIFVDGCIKHSGLDKKTAEHIWSLMVPFGAYGFNKAHSSSYGMVAYWTAYMKARYTVEFMTAYMTSESNNLDKIASAIEECHQMQIEVLPPDINKSFHSFTIVDDITIRYGLSSIKNLGGDVIKHIIKEREAGGAFRDMNDFLDRVCGFSGFNKRSLEALIVSGCLDLLGEKEFEQNPMLQMAMA